MADDLLDQRKNLISLVKERIKKKFGKDYLKLVEITLDCFVDESITFFEEGVYKTDKEHIVKKLKPVILNLKAEKDKKYVGTIKWLGEIRKGINKAIHGDGPNHHVNENIRFYIKNQKENKKNYFVTIFFDLDKIKVAREYDEGRIGIDKKSVVIRDCISAHHKTIFGTRELEWMTGYVAKDIKRGIQSAKINTYFDDEEQPILKELNLCLKKRFEEWSNIEGFGNSYPRPTFGLYKFERNEMSQDDDISFHLRPTNSFNFLEVQRHLSENLARYRERFDACKPYPKISHSISPTIFLILEEDKNRYAVFAERFSSDRIHTGANLFGLPICRTPRRAPEKFLMEKFKRKIRQEKNENVPKKLLQDDREKDKEGKEVKHMNGTYFKNVLMRGAKEELGVKLTKNKIKFLAFGLDTERYLFNVIAFASIKMRRDDLDAQRQNTDDGGRQYFRLHYKAFNPKSICEFLSKISPEKRCPTTHAAAYYACCHSFGLGVTYKAFKNLR